MLFHLCATDQDQRAGQRMAGTGNGHFFEMPTIGDAEDIFAGKFLTLCKSTLPFKLESQSLTHCTYAMDIAASLL